MGTYPSWAFQHPQKSTNSLKREERTSIDNLRDISRIVLRSYIRQE